MAITLTDEEKEIVQELNNDGYEMTVSSVSGLDYFEIGNSNHGLHFSSENKWYQLFDISGIPRGMNKKIASNAFKFMELSAKSMGRMPLFIFRNGSPFEEVEQLPEELKKELSEIEEKPFSTDYYMKKGQKEKVKEMIHFYKEFQNALSEINDTLPGTVFYSELYSFYYMGYKGKFVIKEIDGVCHICITEKNYPVYSVMEVKPTIQKIFSNIEKKRRLKNLFEPPTYIFEKAVDEYYPFQIKYQVKKLWYASLKEVYSPMEIEEKLWKFDNTNVKQIARSLHVIKVDQYIFLLNEEEEWIERFENGLGVMDKIMKTLGEKTKEKLNGFL